MMRAIALLPLLCIGCASFVADRIAVPRGATPPPFAAGLQARFDTKAVPIRLNNGVTLVVRTIEPRDYGFDYRVTRTVDGLRFVLEFPAPAGPVAVARGDVLMLHGWGGDGLAMLPWAGALARNGYRVHVVDLRGHGGSDAAPVGYGPREADDIARLVPHVVADGHGPVHLLGISYGATAALFAEPYLRSRVRGIVALEPFVNAGQAIRSFGTAAAPRWLRPRDQARGLAQAERRLGLDLDAIDLGPVVADARTCVLLVHGAKDGLLPVADARALARLSSRVRYVELADEGHISLPLRSDLYGDAVARWLNEIGDTCPEFIPAAPPAMQPAA